MSQGFGWPSLDDHQKVVGKQFSFSAGWGGVGLGAGKNSLILVWFWLVLVQKKSRDYLTSPLISIHFARYKIASSRHSLEFFPFLIKNFFKLFFITLPSWPWFVRLYFFFSRYC